MGCWMCKQKGSHAPVAGRGLCLRLLVAIARNGGRKVDGDVVFSFNNTAYYVASGFMMKMNKV